MAKITYDTFERMIANQLIQQCANRETVSLYRNGWCENREEYITSSEFGTLYFALVDTLSKDTADDHDAGQAAFLKHFDSDKVKRRIAKYVLVWSGFTKFLKLTLNDLSWERKQ